MKYTDSSTRKHFAKLAFEEGAIRGRATMSVCRAPGSWCGQTSQHNRWAQCPPTERTPKGYPEVSPRARKFSSGTRRVLGKYCILSVSAAQSSLQN